MRDEDLRREVTFKAVRSRGPGGQNVNRVSSAAQMLWPIGPSALFSLDEKARIRTQLAHLTTKQDCIQFRSDEFRDLERNKQRCLDKLRAVLKAALHVPKKRRPTRPSRAAKAKRRDQKSRRSDLKKMRHKSWE